MLLVPRSAPPTVQRSLARTASKRIQNVRNDPKVKFTWVYRRANSSYSSTMVMVTKLMVKCRVITVWSMLGVCVVGRACVCMMVSDCKYISWMTAGGEWVCVSNNHASVMRAVMSHTVIIHHDCLTAWAPSVFGAVWFCRWVVTHSLEDTNFRGHLPAVCTTLNTLSRLSEG